MRILQVIHGYPMRYNAGSEVYTQTLCHGLADNHEVEVFSREEDPFAPDYALRTESDPADPRVTLHLVNVPRSRDRYRHSEVDRRFAEILDRFKPDVVHIGHLNHLSTSLVREAALQETPIVYTLHDYWLMCPRGQFMQRHPEETQDLWAACNGQENSKCAERCYSKLFSGAAEEREVDLAFWGDWVKRRMKHVRDMVELIDVFIAPSQYLFRRYRDEFGLSEGKMVYLDYGFDLERLRSRKRLPGEPFTFGYIGTHIPAKGIHHLIEAFGRVRGDALLRIWGRPRGQETEALHALAKGLPGDASSRVEWLPEYRNQDIIRDVFNRVDAIVVPSIWVENSPLVIHEALQARVPVITANVGGMAELIRNNANGLLFEHRNPQSLASQMQRLADKPELAVQLGERGYLQTDEGNIPSIGSHVAAIESIYVQAIVHRDSTRIKPRKGPWRITFDTNPDTCNLHCIMCEEHSPHSKLQAERKAAGRPHRIMPIELVRKVVAEAANHGLREIIPSTMGEPLLYPEFDSILEICRKHGVKLNLTTNGTFPGRGARAWAECLVPVTSDVKISWNGATGDTQERIMLGSKWENELVNVKEFIEVRNQCASSGGNRCRVSFQLTFLETNVSEIPDIVKLAIDLGVDRVKGHHLWTHFDEIKEMSLRRNADAIHRWNQAVAAAKKIASENPLPNGQQILLENFFPLDDLHREDLAPGGACPFLGQEAWISATGRFNPCCAPDAQRRTLGEFGNLHDLNFEKIWVGEAYRGLVKTYRTRALCQGCNMRKPVGE